MEAVARVIDANINRSLEAARVLEDIARFVLDDAELTHQAKSLRHEVARIGARVRGEAAHARDAAGDVGGAIESESEQTRTSVADIARRASARLGEALRSLEEFTKLEVVGSPEHDADSHRQFKAARYNSYTISQRIILRLSGQMAGACPQWRVCVLVSESLCKHHTWERVCELAFAGGADCVQLREKELADRELLSRASRLVAIAREHAKDGSSRPHVVINDRPDIALLAGADGTHVGPDDLSPIDAARAGQRRLWIGCSCATIDDARRAANAGADTIALGPMFATETKAKPVAAGPALINQILADNTLRHLPHLFIGGITPENAGELIARGARGLAVSSAVCSSTGPRRVVERLVACFGTR